MRFYVNATTFIGYAAGGSMTLDSIGDFEFAGQNIAVDAASAQEALLIFQEMARSSDGALLTAKTIEITGGKETEAQQQA